MRSYLGPADERSLADDVLDGLTRPLKEIAPKHFYDARGAELFDRICELDEYYPTRAERAILEAHAPALVAAAGGGAAELVEPGSGTAAKTRLLLRAMAGAGTLRRYVPLDVTESMVRASADALVDEFPGLRVHGIVGDFERHLRHVPAPGDGPRIVAFLGGTIGNFPPGSRRRLLRRMARLLRPGSDDRLLLGTDMVKDPAVLEAAYDDGQGVTAAFNLNLLHVLNRELGADFDVDAFEHVAFYDREREWIELRLRATRRMDVRIAALDLDVTFAAREEMRTELSAKFTRERLHARPCGRRAAGRRGADRPGRPLRPVAQRAAWRLAAPLPHGPPARARWGRARPCEIAHPDWGRTRLGIGRRSADHGQRARNRHGWGAVAARPPNGQGLAQLMTDLLIRAFSRRPLRTLAQPSAVLAFTLAVAYGCGFWLNLLHRAEGGTERNEPGVLLHWLRDSTLSLPLVFTAVWLGILLARRVIRRHGAELSAGLAGAVVAGTVALTTALALGASSPMHAGLFGASHGGPELPYALHLARDTLLSLAVTLPLCAVVATALLRRQPWAEPQIARWRSLNGRQRHGFQAAVTLVLVLPVFIFAQGAAETATAGAGAGAPCPASSPTKRYDVTALDVKIPLNRFGDNDPQGKMFALTNRVDDVRAQERSQKVSIGLHGDDAIQPLVIRANMGDCVEIAFANDATGGDYGIHIDGLAHDVASSGDAIGDNAPSGTEEGEKRLYRFYVPDDPEIEGTHYIRPGPGYRQAVTHGLFGALSVEPRGSTYLHPETRKPLESGWEAIIQPPTKKAFREYALLHHEVGNEDEKVFDKEGKDLPMKDPHHHGLPAGHAGR